MLQAMRMVSERFIFPKSNLKKKLEKILVKISLVTFFPRKSQLRFYYSQSLHASKTVSRLFPTPGTNISFRFLEVKKRLRRGCQRGVRMPMPTAFFGHLPIPIAFFRHLPMPISGESPEIFLNCRCCQNFASFCPICRYAEGSFLAICRCR